MRSKLRSPLAGVPSLSALSIDMRSSPQPRAAIKTDILAVNIAPRSAAQINHEACDILWSPQAAQRILLAHHALAAEVVDLRLGEARREETRREDVGRDVFGRQLQRQVAAEMMCRSLGDRVHDRAACADVWHDDAAHRGGYQDP